MNKVAQYLHTHMLGEITTDLAVRQGNSVDGSVLTMTPDMVAFPRVTNDIRKAARFAWQLAEKGHVLSVTARGSGSDTTGGAIGSGLIISLSAHMNRIYEYDAKQKLIRLQPGVTVNAVQNALSLQGTAVEGLQHEHPYATMGGVVARSRRAYDVVDQLEIVLANGDTLQTKRLSKREMSKKKGIQNFEGEIYRKLDALIDDNKELIKNYLTADASLDHSGYHGLGQVKAKDGSFDLAPLFCSSQGTLGVISEMILKSEYVNQSPSMVVAAFNDVGQARDAIDAVEKHEPTAVEYISGDYFEVAREAGKQFAWFEEARGNGDVAAVLVLTFNDFSQRSRLKKANKVLKALRAFEAVATMTEEESSSDLQAVRSATNTFLGPEHKEDAALPLIDGAYIPLARLDEFIGAVADLAKKHHVTLPLYGRPLDGVWFARPVLRLGTVGGKQKVFKLIADYNTLLNQHQGTLFGSIGEGRLKNFAATSSTPPELTTLFAQVREIFDPFGIMNSGVKQSGDVRTLAKQLRTSFEPSHASDFPPSF